MLITVDILLKGGNAVHGQIYDESAKLLVSNLILTGKFPPGCLAVIHNEHHVSYVDMTEIQAIRGDKENFEGADEN